MTGLQFCVTGDGEIENWYSINNSEEKGREDR